MGKRTSKKVALQLVVGHVAQLLPGLRSGESRNDVTQERLVLAASGDGHLLLRQA